MSDKKPLTPQERQTFIDKLPPQQVNPQAKETFDKIISKAAQPQKQDKQDKN